MGTPSAPWRSPPPPFDVFCVGDLPRPGAQEEIQEGDHKMENLQQRKSDLETSIEEMKEAPRKGVGAPHAVL